MTKPGSQRQYQEIQDKSIEEVKKNHFMLMKGKIHNKGIRYTNL